MMCRLLKLSRSGFYAWLKRPESHRQKRLIKVSATVEATFFGYKKRYGAPRITMELNAQGIDCCVNHVAKILQEKGLRARNGKGFKYRARIESKTNVSDNLLARRFKVDEPNRKWVSDITYIRVGRSWLYLAVVIDLFSRKVIGWSLDNHMREGLILEAFNMAVSCRDIEKSVLLHSDRGVQYRGHEYQHALKENGILCSMSRKGNCWDNAVMESFFGRLKVELIYAENYKTVEDTHSGIFEYIEIFYNKQRRHSAIGYMCPNEYEKQYNQLNVSTFCG
jgi:transposase InsO family protein